MVEFRNNKLVALIFVVCVTVSTSSLTRNNNIHTFYDIARSTCNKGSGQECTDKITGEEVLTGHTYHVMYGMFLVPLAEQLRKGKIENIKLFELGLGCAMLYGTGKSVVLWQRLFGDNFELWEADIDKRCVEKWENEHQHDNVHVLHGDASSTSDLSRWLELSGGNFDVIIDDASHQNHQMKVSFDYLFDRGLNPGGLYFIEDISFSRSDPLPWGISNRGEPFAEIIQTWIEQLLVPEYYISNNDVIMERRKRHPIPNNVKWIFCQHEACVIAKCEKIDCRPVVFSTQK
mmetsp:Transcript_21108/g.30513  ORF Transcript_21108/g.30513 Transcript_21108/m.30513 type:complete len:289 (-) Transcript_21108:147-1013(-)|eukprot:CAMPEP_0185038634 /NCGR_PEP_ID=MMETSP1103-20130426/34524_1 /TAXON_ID=36769 /ORGANISM="Paraphysomonas bandaiensis, Strain Caron Lab Isolate" /LENGTH=288 /DNA_ID=CAMNT_0027577153 /DNA_START=15 /DNA_END=881 /DNA_ORIENTATION=+